MVWFCLAVRSFGLVGSGKLRWKTYGSLTRWSHCKSTLLGHASLVVTSLGRSGKTAAPACSLHKAHFSQWRDGPKLQYIQAPENGVPSSAVHSTTAWTKGGCLHVRATTMSLWIFPELSVLKPRMKWKQWYLNLMAYGTKGRLVAPLVTLHGSGIFRAETVRLVSHADCPNTNPWWPASQCKHATKLDRMQFLTPCSNMNKMNSLEAIKVVDAGTTNCVLNSKHQLGPPTRKQEATTGILRHMFLHGVHWLPRIVIHCVHWSAVILLMAFVAGAGLFPLELSHGGRPSPYLKSHAGSSSSKIIKHGLKWALKKWVHVPTLTF